MKKSLNKIKLVILFFVTICISCSKKSEIESIFIANKNEYWKYNDYCQDTRGIYFQFKNNSSHDKFVLYSKEGFHLFNDDGDLLSGPRTWSIKNDSTFIFDEEEYKIEKITEKEILLSYYHYKIKDKKCFVKLSKWVDGPEGPRPLNGTYKPEE